MKIDQDQETAFTVRDQFAIEIFKVLLKTETPIDEVLDIGKRSYGWADLLIKARKEK